MKIRTSKRGVNQLNESHNPSETEKMLRFYEAFYHHVWSQDWVSSDKVYEWTEAVKMEQQFDPYDADQAQIKQELAQLRKEP